LSLVFLELKAKATMKSLITAEAFFMFPLLILFTSFCNLEGALASPEEAEALLNWKVSFLSHNNPKLSSWNTKPTNGTNYIESANPCTWYGVSCIDGRINQLNLTNSGVKGTLHNFPFSTLPNLEFLDLSANQLFGSIPSQMGNLTNLTLLYLYDNQLSGSIPIELGNLDQLSNFALSHNNLSGLIHTSLGNLTKLIWLYLNDNGLFGSIPKELGNLKQLRDL
jgi:Leucine-rich repeat (LRR) protein